MLIHTGDKPHSCENCGESFSIKGNLKAHMHIHLAGKLHCELCGKSFSHKGNLDRHMLIHSGDKPHSCEACGKS